MDVTSDHALLAALAPLHCLLILDNSEDALYGPAPTPRLFRALIARILEQTARVALLVTSRQSLCSSGSSAEFVERLITVGPLSRDDRYACSLCSLSLFCFFLIADC